METREAGRLATQVEAVIEQIRTRMPAEQAEGVCAFASRFFAQVAPEDLEDLPVGDLYGAVLSQWHFVARRQDGSKVRAFNPRLDEHGWECPHTVVEIAGEDMPFLVDSITMEVARQGLTLHLIIHPVMNVARDAEGGFVRVAERGEQGEGVGFESIMHLEVDRRTDPGDLVALQQGIEHVLADVRAAVRDWSAMRERLAEADAVVDADMAEVVRRDRHLDQVRDRREGQRRRCRRRRGGRPEGLPDRGGSGDVERRGLRGGGRPGGGPRPGLRRRRGGQGLRQ